jgi:hypothetical protein
MEPIYRGKSLNLNYGRENPTMTTLSRHPFVYIWQKTQNKNRKQKSAVNLLGGQMQ